MRYVYLGVAGAVALFTLFLSAHVVPPGSRGVKVTFGTTDTQPLPEGLSFSNPLATVYDISVKQTTAMMDSECFSSDLQQIKTHVKVLYRVPEKGVVEIFRSFAGDPLKMLVEPRVHEALKEATATRSAEGLVKNREQVKSVALALAQKKLNFPIEVDDLVIEDLALSEQLRHAIELKMVQEQEAEKAKFTQQKAEIDAKTAVIRAQGEAEAIKVRGDALRASPGLVQLQIVEKWNGVAPLYVGGGGSGANVIFPVSK